MKRKINGHLKKAQVKGKTPEPIKSLDSGLIRCYFQKKTFKHFYFAVLVVCSVRDGLGFVCGWVGYVFILVDVRYLKPFVGVNYEFRFPQGFDPE